MPRSGASRGRSRSVGPRGRRVFIFTLVVLASLCGAAAADDYTIGMCYATDTDVECAVGKNRDDLEQYARSQCNFTRDPKSPKCVLAVTCTQRGWFMVRHANNSRSLVSRCGVPQANRKEAETWLALNCRDANCITESWWLGPWETDGEQNRSGDAAPTESAQAPGDPRVQPEQPVPPEPENTEHIATQGQHEKPEQANPERNRPEHAHKPQQTQQKHRADERAKTNGARGHGGSGHAPSPEAQRQRQIAQGFQDFHQAQNTNHQLGNASATVAGTVFMIQGGNQGTESTTRAVQLAFGFGGRFLPHMSNTTGRDFVEKSTTDIGGGFAFDGSLELWPRYMKKYGFAIGAEGGLAGMALPGGAMYALQAGIGVKGYLGNRARWTLRGEVERATRLVGSSANLFGALVSGSGSYSLWRFGVGPGFCKTASKAGFCETSFYALLLLDWTSIPDHLGTGGGGRTGTVVRLGTTVKYMPFGAEIELGFGYPATGETKYPIEPEDMDRAGMYFVLLLRKAWTWHYGGARR